MRGVRWLAVEICIKGLREGDSFSFFGGGLSMLVSFRAAKMQTNTGNVPFSRVIGFLAERDDFHCIVRSIPLYLVRDRIAEMALVSPFPCTNFTHAYFIRIVSSIEPHSRTTYHSRGATISSHFVALVAPRKRGSLGGIHDGV